MKRRLTKGWGGPNWGKKVQKEKGKGRPKKRERIGSEPLGGKS